MSTHGRCEGEKESTLKWAEREEGLVARIYEARGEGAEVSLKVAGRWCRIWEADLLERRRRGADPGRLRLGPFGVRTLLTESQRGRGRR